MVSNDLDSDSPTNQKKFPKIYLKDNANVISIRAVFLFLIGTLFTSVLLEMLPWNKNISNLFCKIPTQPTFAVYGKSSNEDHLLHVLKVLNELGYKRVDLAENWDLLWAHDYPFFQMEQRMKNLHSNQIVNHLPGCGYLTNKVDLSTTALPFLPRAFKLPRDREDFKQYSAENPKKLFVEKHNEHRQILIKSRSNISLDSTNTFVQEFIENPLLVDGHKFDVGVYVLITSIDPLRVYIYTGDVLFRYCPVPYYPLERTNVDKYVVGDDYLPTWDVPSLSKYYKMFGGSMKSSFNAYISDQSLNPSIIWHQVEDIIRQTILYKEADIARIMRSYKTKNFFDLMRFDFIIDSKLKVYLMEANMSPNLSSAHFKENTLLYEQILYSVLNLVGIGSPIRSRLSLTDYGTNEDEIIITAEKDLATNLNICRQYECDKACNNPACELCLPCISGSNYRILFQAHQEHLHRVSMKRIFPKPIVAPTEFDLQKETANLTKRNKLITEWYYNKCLEDNSWCL